MFTRTPKLNNHVGRSMFATRIRPALRLQTKASGDLDFFHLCIFSFDDISNFTSIKSSREILCERPNFRSE